MKEIEVIIDTEEIAEFFLPRTHPPRLCANARGA
ncbi:hypothetical protein I656_03951 [Geobacillus sp. WSUCF1]|nr:hypothetical protein I656_03951 [Geobacillus sp. WSUCF1]